MQRSGVYLGIMIELEVGFVQQRALEPADTADESQLNVGMMSVDRFGDRYRRIDVSTGSPSRDHNAH